MELCGHYTAGQHCAMSDILLAVCHPSLACLINVRLEWMRMGIRMAMCVSEMCPLQYLLTFWRMQVEPVWLGQVDSNSLC